MKDNADQRITGAMPTEIDLDQLHGLIERGDVQLVEVLPEREYEEEHLPGAINISLKKVTTDAVSHLDRRRPVIVYCWDET